MIIENILYILLFVLCLSVLIVIHELGHLTAAKIFKVYCLEFSIGFGPALIHKKKKTGETYFSLRVIPLGGYVSMYGEGVELPEGQNIPKERSLEGIKAWKKAIIMFAGVFMNSILALNLFFVKNIALPDSYIYPHIAEVSENSLAAQAGIEHHSYIRLYGMGPNEGTEADTSNQNQVFYSQGYFYVGEVDLDRATVYYTDGTTKVAGQYIDSSKITSFDKRNLLDMLVLYEIQDNHQTKLEIEINENVSKVDLVIRTVPVVYNEETGKNEYDLANSIPHLVTTPVITKGEGENISYSLQDIGYNLALIQDERLTFGEAVKQTFVDFGESSITIAKGLINIFTKDGINEVGGIVALSVTSSSVLKNMGLSRFIYLWGMISVNLAIINLLPFPGLDGWHLLVVAIESITRKKVPQKAKAIASFIGLAILFTLMIAIVVLDIIKIATGVITL